MKSASLANKLGKTLLVLWACALAAQAGTALAEGGPFGMGVYLGRVMGDAQVMDRVAGLAQQAGAGWTREDFIWDNIEPARGQYDYALLEDYYDRMVDNARARGLKILGLIVYGNSWSSGDQAPYLSQHYQDFAGFVSFLVNRYRGRIQHWEIWNEPNNYRFWPPQANPTHYTELLKHAYQAAKATDPSVRVVGCATVGDDLAYVVEVLEQGGGAYMDAISLHPYPQGPLEWSQEAFNVLLLQELLPQLGATGKPIWFTEAGYSTYSGANGVTEQRQAQLIARTYLTAISLGVEVTMWYDFKEDGLDPANLEHHFGIVTSENASPALDPKPAYNAFANLTQNLAGGSLVETYHLGGDRVGVLMAGGPAPKVLAVWAAEDTSGPLSIGIQGRVYRADDIWGNPHEYTQEGNTLSTQVSGSPIYLRGDFQVVGHAPVSLGKRP